MLPGTLVRDWSDGRERACDRVQSSGWMHCVLPSGLWGPFGWSFMLAFGAQLSGDLYWEFIRECCPSPSCAASHFPVYGGTSSLAGNAETKVRRMSLVRRCPGWELGSVRYRSEAAALWSIT